MLKTDSNCPPIAEVLRRVSYSPETGVFTAKVSAGKRAAGAALGYADANGYVKLSFNGKWVMAHRLAWTLCNGSWPRNEIDHINGNPSDNRIANLREATRSQNAMNTRRGNGLCWRPSRNKWQVLIKADGKSHFIGMLADRAKAEIAAADATKRLHGEFASVDPPAPAPVQEALL
jgi:hypothetical protein